MAKLKIQLENYKIGIWKVTVEIFPVIWRMAEYFQSSNHCINLLICSKDIKTEKRQSSFVV